MRFSPRGDSIQQNRQTVFRFKAIEIRAIGTELSEKRRVVRGYSLPDDRDAKPRIGGGSGGAAARKRSA